MLHLAAERLAALADSDETPTALEAAHLDACRPCCRERDAYRTLTAMAAAERGRPGTPVSDWDTIWAGVQGDASRVSRLASGDGSADVISIEQARRARDARRETRDARVPLWARRAAAAVLIAGGLVAGRASATAGPWAVRGDAPPPATPVPTPVAAAPASPAAEAGTRLVADSAPAFRSREEALAVLAMAERQYQAAAIYLSGREGAGEQPEQPAAIHARLAALDDVMAASREALYAAPTDPVVNRYYLAALGAREATIRQLNVSLPAGQQVNRF